MSIYAVASFMDYANHRSIAGKTTVNQAAPFDYYMLGGSGVPRLVRGNGTASSVVAGTTAASLNSPHLLHASARGTDIAFYLDGRTNGTAIQTVTPADNGGQLWIGHRFTDQATTMKGDIAELMIFGSSLSDADRTAMDLYLAGKYNLQIGTAPRLSIMAASGNSLTLAWPVPTLNFVLESATNLTTSPWNIVTNAVTTLNGTNTVTVTGEGDQQLYRLRRP
jgi:hypothetical protein